VPTDNLGTSCIHISKVWIQTSRSLLLRKFPNPRRRKPDEQLDKSTIDRYFCSKDKSKDEKKKVAASFQEQISHHTLC
jgi:hypothetical protein